MRAFYNILIFLKFAEKYFFLFFLKFFKINFFIQKFRLSLYQLFDRRIIANRSKGNNDLFVYYKDQFFSFLKIKCMSKAKVQNQKTTTVPASKETVKEVQQLNLSKFTDLLKNRELTEKKTRETIYIYPENLNTEEKRNSKEGKKFRSNLRRTLEKHCTNILIFVKYAREEDLKKEVKTFGDFYKKFYKTNDFSVNSVSQSNKEERASDLKMMFEIIQTVNK